LVSKIDIGLFALAALAVFLVIRGAGQALGNIGNPFEGLKFPSIGDITFPDIKFPSLFPEPINQFPNAEVDPVTGEVLVLPLTQPGEGGLNPADAPTNPTPVDIALSEGLPLPPLTPEEIALDPNQDPTKFLPPSTIIDTQPTSIANFVSQIMAPQPVVQQPGLTAIVTPAEPEPTSALNIGQEQPFTEAPLGALSLSAIIDQFMVTASEAANIKFIAQQGGDPFAEPSNIFGENPPAVSDSQFQGLTPEQIFLQLVGGNISNF